MSHAVDRLRFLWKPDAVLQKQLERHHTPHRLLLQVVTPLAAIRSAATLVRSLLTGTPTSGFVLGIAELALALGTWLALSVLLPALARQFRSTLTSEQGFGLITAASVPFWLAGVLELAPDEPTFFRWWAAGVMMLAAAYGFFLTYRAFVVVGIQRNVRLPLLATAGVAALTVHGFLFFLLGVGSHVVLFVLT